MDMCGGYGSDGEDEPRRVSSAGVIKMALTLNKYLHLKVTSTIFRRRWRSRRTAQAE